MYMMKSGIFAESMQGFFFIFFLGGRGEGIAIPVFCIIDTKKLPVYKLMKIDFYCSALICKLACKKINAIRIFCDMVAAA